MRRVLTVVVAAAGGALAIQGGTPATDYPEAVLVNGCSGVLLSPLLALTAGHCHAATYSIVAPNAGGQTSSGTRSLTNFTGNASASLDIRVVVLETPIVLEQYATLRSAPVPAGTVVRDIGRTLNGSHTTQLWISPPVTIVGNGSTYGFPFNYGARPDISQGGDSGGPIVVNGTHDVVGLVDTDICPSGCEHKGPYSPPVDLFTRGDLLYTLLLRDERRDDYATELLKAALLRH
jgi:hypothetical protein